MSKSFAKLSELRPGQLVRVDGGFTCIEPNAVRMVMEDKHGLYVLCAGPEDDDSCDLFDVGCHHYLSGQAGGENHDEDECIGVYSHG